MESEKQHLSEAVESLRERAQSNSEARVREVEAENRLMHQSITDISSRLVSLETQLKQASEEAERLRERAERCEEVEREAARVERSRDALNREVMQVLVMTHILQQIKVTHTVSFFSLGRVSARMQ